MSFRETALTALVTILCLNSAKILLEKREERSRPPALTAAATDVGPGYYARMEVNGRDLGWVLVDSGASAVTLTPEDASRAGVRFSARAAHEYETANGTMRCSQSRATVAVDQISLTNVRVAVCPMKVSVLGMTFLREVSFGARNGRQMIMTREK